MIRPLVRGIVGIGLVLGVSFAVLQFGLARPGASDRLAARVVRVLDVTRGRGALVTLGSARLRASCRRITPGTIRIHVGGTEIVASGPHILRLRPLAGERSLAAHRAPELTAAELVLVGSHALFARQLGGLLQRRSVGVVPTRFDGRPAYVVRLRPARPRVTIVVDARTLRPLAAAYRSASVSGSSRLIGGGGRLKGC